MDNLQTFTPGIQAPEEQLEPALWFAFQGDKLLVELQGSSPSIPCVIEFTEVGLEAKRQHYLGQRAGCHCYGVELPGGSQAPAGKCFLGLRSLYGRIDEDLFSLAGRALQIVDWDRTHQFCGRCGTRTIATRTERAKECPQCGLLHFPRLSPAVIVLIERGDQLLMARSQQFPPEMYSVIAGFVEPVAF